MTTEERHPRLGALGRRHQEGRLRQRLDGGDPRAGGLRVDRLALDADEAAAEALGHGAGGAGAEERVEHHVAGIGRRQQGAGEQRLGLLGRMDLAAVGVLQPLVAGAERDEPVGAHLEVVVAALQRLVMEGVALRLRRARGPDQGLVRIGEALAAEVRHRVGLAPDDVVQDPVAEILQRAPDPEDVVVGADDPEGRVRLHHAAAGGEPVAREGVVGCEGRELVPVVVDGVDAALVGTQQAGFAELEVVGRIGEHAVDARRRKGVHGRDAIPDEDLVEGQGTLGGYETHPWRRRGPPGTRDLFPGDGVGSHGTRGSHGKHRLRD